jgi:filamentous hemagglutinin family protein
MKRIHKIVWPAIRQKRVVVPEKASCKGCLTILVGSLGLAAQFGLAGPAFCMDPGELPTGGTITAGSGQVSSDGSVMTINQTSQKLIAEWESFNIGSEASVRFVQPGRDATALNRISDQNPSTIFGSLAANGQVFLINPRGIIFGSTAQVDVGALVATTLDMQESDFLAGRYRFSGSGRSGSITNEGSIRSADGGVVAFIAPKVVNAGRIESAGGSVALVAGSSVSLDFQGRGLISYTVDEGALGALAENRGLVKVGGGMVVMTAKAADAVRQSVVNHTGIIEADGMRDRGGRIFLDADGGMTTVSGTLDASSVQGRGGRIVVTGDRVAVGSGAHLNASGYAGGGEVLVGGSWQNSDPAVRQATGTVIDYGALLEANATGLGDGGTVVAWSDVKSKASVTRAYGTFEAKGGVLGGNGGRIETSGHWLDIAGSRGSASAVSGNAGVWLFDPYDVTVTSAKANGDFTSNSGTDTWLPSGGSSTILNTDITSRLDAGTNVVITTGSYGPDSGDITVNSGIITGTTGATRSLTLKADRDIILNAEIGNTTGMLDLTFNANRTIRGTGDLSGSGGITFNMGSGTGTFGGVISGTRSLTKSGSGTLVLSGANSYSGVTTIEGGTLSITNDGALGTTAGNTTVKSGATLDLQNVTSTEPIVLKNGGKLSVSTGAGTFGGLVDASDVGTATLFASPGATLTLPTLTSGAKLTYTLQGGGDFILGSAESFQEFNDLTLDGIKNLTWYEANEGTLAITTSTTALTGNLEIWNENLLTMRGGILSSSGSRIFHGPLSLRSSSDISMYGSSFTFYGTVDSRSVNGTFMVNASNNGPVEFKEAVRSKSLSIYGGILTAQSIDVSGLLSVNNSLDSVITGLISGSGGLTLGGNGKLTLARPDNTYTGATSITQGILSVSRLSNGGSQSSIGASSSASANLKVSTSGWLQYTGGTVAIDRGINLFSGGGIEVVDSGATLSVGGVIQPGGGPPIGSFVKSGLGTLMLTGNNTYTISTIVREGVLRAGSNNALGTTANGTTVMSGAALELSGGITIGAEALTISGSGIGNGGALRSVGGTNIWRGPITLGADSRINTDDGTLTVDVTSGNAISGAFNVTFGGAGNTTVADPIATGSGNLTKDGTGTLLLRAANTYTGMTTINAGTLSINADSGLGVVPGATVANQLVFGGGTLATTSDFILSSNRGVTLAGAGRIDTADGTTLNYSGVIMDGSGSHSLTKTGGGTLVLGGVNTYDGGTVINGGTLSISADAALGNVPGSAAVANLTINDGTLATTSDFTLNANRGITLTGEGRIDTANGTKLSYGGVITDGSGSFRLTKAGGGTLVLGGVNTYDGGTVINGGTLSISADAALGNVPGSAAVANLTINDGTLATTSDFTLSTNRWVTLTGAGTIDTEDGTTLSYSGVITDGTGSFRVTKAGGGTLVLGGVNSYDGGTTIGAGRLTASNASALGSSGSLIMDGSTVLENTVALDLGLRSVLLNGNVRFETGSNLNIAGVIDDGSGVGGFTKSGVGTLLLSGANSYDGTTVIEGGTARVSNVTALGSTAGSTVVGAGAALELAASVGNEALDLSGTLRNYSGSNSYDGAITLGGDALVTNFVTGTTLTLGSTVNGAFGLTVDGSDRVTVTGAIGNITQLASFTGSEATPLSINGGLVKTTGSQIYAGPTTFGAATLFETTGGGDIIATGAVAATAGTTTFSAGSGDVRFANVSNDFSAGAILITSADDVDIVDSNGTELSGVNATGAVRVSTLQGDLTISGDIRTTNASDRAIMLNAGKSRPAGDAEGGNILIGGSPTISTGAGGRAMLYTGGISRSSGLISLVGVGSGNFRYFSDEETTSFTPPLGPGVYAIYREPWRDWPLIPGTKPPELVEEGTVTPPSLVSVADDLQEPAKAYDGVIVQLVRQPSGYHAGLILVWIPETLIQGGSTIDFPLPGEVKRMLSSASAVETVTLPGGGALPGWLSYDMKSRTFRALRIPDGALPARVQLDALEMHWNVVIAIGNAT